MIIWPDSSQSNVVYPGRQVLDAEAILGQLRHRLAGRVERAYTFGSINTGRFHPGSDVDLILVCACPEPFHQRPQRFQDLYAIYPDLDILVYNPDELHRLLAEPVGFWKSVAQSMRAIL